MDESSLLKKFFFTKIIQTQKLDEEPTQSVRENGRFSFCSPLSHRALAHPVPAPPRRGSQVAIVNSGKVGGQAEFQKSLPHRYLPDTYGRTLGSPCGGAGAKRLRGMSRPAHSAKIETDCINIHKMSIQKTSMQNCRPRGIKKRKQKRKNSKSGLDTGGVCYNAFERKGPSFQPVLGLYLLYTIRRKNSLTIRRKNSL